MVFLIRNIVNGGIFQFVWKISEKRCDAFRYIINASAWRKYHYKTVQSLHSRNVIHVFNNKKTLNQHNIEIRSILINVSNFRNFYLSLKSFWSLKAWISIYFIIIIFINGHFEKINAQINQLINCYLSYTIYY